MRLIVAGSVDDLTAAAAEFEPIFTRFAKKLSAIAVAIFRLVLASPSLERVVKKEAGTNFQATVFFSSRWHAQLLDEKAAQEAAALCGHRPDTNVAQLEEHAAIIARPQELIRVHVAQNTASCASVASCT